MFSNSEQIHKTWRAFGALHVVFVFSMSDYPLKEIMNQCVRKLNRRCDLCDLIFALSPQRFVRFVSLSGLISEVSRATALNMNRCRATADVKFSSFYYCMRVNAGFEFNVA